MTFDVINIKEGFILGNVEIFLNIILPIYLNFSNSASSYIKKNNSNHLQIQYNLMNYTKIMNLLSENVSHNLYVSEKFKVNNKNSLFCFKMLVIYEITPSSLKYLLVGRQIKVK